MKSSNSSKSPKSLKLSIPLSILLFALPTLTFASSTSMQSDAATGSEKLYIGVFGGGGSSKHLHGRQFGTALFREAVGGPLSVNAFGRIEKKRSGFYGAQLGFQAREKCFFSSSEWTLAPAVELESFVMNKSTFKGEFFNEVDRLPEHDFLVSYGMRRSVFLANAVLNFNNPCFIVNPYVGFGIGSAIVKIRDARAKQIRPPERGVNHFNASTKDTTSTFAGQIKLGVSYDISECVSLFAEYRFLYLANTLFVFGSTVYPTHAETSSWQVKLSDQKYNLGNVGIRYNW